MRSIGFSTGALAYADFNLALHILENKRTKVVELSALREAELEPLVDALDALDLTRYSYVSFHAPSRFTNERQTIQILNRVADRGWPIIVHPDTIQDFSAWQSFGGLLLIENMDKRNTAGRTARELAGIFEKLPHANLCFDLGHCRQVDPTMNESCLILRQFGDRLKQLHVSEVNTRSTHDPLSISSVGAFLKVAEMIPENVPAILESPVSEDEVLFEIEKARIALQHSATRETQNYALRVMQFAAY